MSGGSHNQSKHFQFIKLRDFLKFAMSNQIVSGLSNIKGMNFIVVRDVEIVVCESICISKKRNVRYTQLLCNSSFVRESVKEKPRDLIPECKIKKSEYIE